VSRVAPWVLGAIVTLAVAGCFHNNALHTTQTENPDFVVDHLFTHDGCDVYRFTDNHPVYYVNCHGQGGDTASTDQSISCGRGCTRSETVVTTPVSP
jgi:hypothetical protein